MNVYEQVRAVPKEAQKSIAGGKLKGMTDINPMWRIKKLTEVFGMAGIGWYYDIVDKWCEETNTGETGTFVQINLYVKVDGEWSRPIVGVGGSSVVALEKGSPRMNDEAYKMALTDAISVACKALGVGADIYWQADKTKYSTATDATETPAPVYKCCDCGKPFEDYEKDGKHYTAQRIYAAAVQKNTDGKARCKTCREKKEAEDGKTE